MAREVYLDNAATTATDPAVAQQVAADLVAFYANPSSGHRPGLQARRRLEAARGLIAERLPGYRVAFTASGTEAIHLAIRGAFRRRARGTHRVLVSAVEHPAVLQAAAAMEAQGGVVEQIPVLGDGRLDLDALRERLEAVGTEVAVLAVMTVQNELGTYMPVAEAGQLLRAHAPEAFYFTDAVQGLGKVDVDPEGWGAHGCAFASHKVHGPKGMGCLLLREGVTIEPQLTGGGQESGLRSGTPDVAGAWGFATAFAAAFDATASHRRHLYELRTRLASGLRRVYPGAVVNGPVDPDKVAPSILSMSFRGLRGERVQHALEQDGVYVSTGSACHSGDRSMSHVQRAVGMNAERAAGTVRFGLSWTTTADEIDYAVACAEKRIAELRGTVTSP
jgi:cysteine desulfurase